MTNLTGRMYFIPNNYLDFIAPKQAGSEEELRKIEQTEKEVEKELEKEKKNEK